MGQLCHITEEQFIDAVTDAPIDTKLDTNGNDTNEDALLYFTRISKHQYFYYVMS